MADTPAPAAPAAAPATPAPPAAPASALHASTRQIFETLGMAVGEDVTLKPLTTPVPAADVTEAGETNIPEHRRTLGDIAMEAAERAKREAAAAAAPAAPAPGAPAAAAPAAPAPAAPAAPPAAAAVKPIEIKRPAVDDLAARVTRDVLSEVKKLQATTEPAAPAAPAAPSAEAQWEASLPEENREMLELLRWGEANGVDVLKGKAAEQATYFRRLEEFARSNPEEEALTDWVQKNRPAIPERLLRKTAESRLLKQAREEAIEEVRRENDQRISDVEARQRVAEVRPLVDKVVGEFWDGFERNVVGDKTPAGTPRIPSAAAKMLRTHGVDAAAADFPIEAPILHQYSSAARTLLELRNGLVDHDPMNPTHQWLGGFLIRQEQALLRKPEGERIINGKQFLPAQVYYAQLAKNPAIAGQYTTFTDQNLLELLEEAAHKHVSNEYQRLEKAGFVRRTAAAAPPPSDDSNKSPKTQPPAPAAAAGAETPPEDPNAAPRAGSSIAPGAAVPGEKLNPNIDFMRKAFPGVDIDKVLAGG